MTCKNFGMFATCIFAFDMKIGISARYECGRVFILYKIL